ncbi:MAG: hypothetical protein K8R53_04600 [Bacteroidales bacterium]|nr:hypothetical protein [Bacteroidales bacterium]
MKEESCIGKLENFAKETGFDYYTNSDVKVKNFALLPNERFLKPEYVVFDLQKISKNMHLVFYSLRSTRYGSSSTFCGLFLKIPVCENEIRIRKRVAIGIFDWSKREKTGNSFIDKKVTILKENNKRLPVKLDSKSIREFVDLTKKIMPIEIVSIRNSKNLIPLLNSNNWISLIINNRWVMESDKLKSLVTKGSRILDSIKN